MTAIHETAIHEGVFHEAAVGVAAIHETAVGFDCAGDSLVGVLAVPKPPLACARAAVVIVVGGPQVRAGSHRQFTLLARALAAAGVPSLRFDVRGMGDATGAQRDFESLGADIAAAIDCVSGQVASVDRVVLWGLCDGAAAALLYLDEVRDPRVAGLCLVNPWVRSPATQATTQVKHYYRDRLFQLEFWRKLVGGKVAISALRESLVSVATMLRGARGSTRASRAGATRPFQQRMTASLERFGGPVLIALSGRDYTAKEFEEFARGDPVWRRELALPSRSCVKFADADHTFSDSSEHAGLLAAVIDWIGRSGIGVTAAARGT